MRAAIWLLPLVAACSPPATEEPYFDVACPGAGDYPYADVIVDAPGTVSAPSAINEPDNAINGVVDGDLTSGSLDVFSRGLGEDNNYVVLRWSGRRVVDVDGPDFVVFENAFKVAEDNHFMDLIVVEVSNDAKRWVAFDYDYVADDETRYSNDPDHWLGFAGKTPVAWKSASCTDPLADEAGGDRFDLADLDDPELSQGFTYLRLTAAPTVINPDTGAPFVKHFLADGFDLDGVFAAQTAAE